MNEFKAGCLDWMREYSDSLESVGDEPVYGRRYDKRLSDISDRVRHNKYHRLTRRAARAILIAAIIAALLTVTAYATPGIREYILERCGDLVGYFVSGSTNNAPIVTGISVGYIPDGFELIEKTEYKNFYTYKYAFSDRLLYVGKNRLNGNIAYDAEEFDPVEITKNGIKYVCYRPSADHLAVLWIDGSYIYEVYGQVSEEELFKIAEQLH